MAPSTSSTSSNTSATVVLPTVSANFFIKLDRTNYNLWLAQISPLIKGRKLRGFIDGTCKCPPQFIVDAAGKDTEEINPAYDEWLEKDQTVLGWINNSVSTPVLSTIARFQTSFESWKSLEKRYASSCQNRIMQLRYELLQIKGDGLSISDFLDKIHTVADSLALAGKPVDDDDIISIIMNNVGSAYESTVSSAQARDTPISYDTLVALLLSAEMRLKNQNTPSIEINPTAMYAPKSAQSNSRGRGYMSNSRTNIRGRSRGRGYSGGGFSQGSASAASHHNRPTCQICKCSGHTAIDCYNRMNVAYEGRVPTRQLTAMAAAASFHNTPSTWISDTGASNHITADLANLAIHEPYNGNDRVAVGNGSGPKDGEDAFPREE